MIFLFFNFEIWISIFINAAKLSILTDNMKVFCFILISLKSIDSFKIVIDDNVNILTVSILKPLQ